MRLAFTIGAIAVAAVVAFLIGRATPPGDGRPDWVDGSFIISTPGTDGFCNARVERAMRGRAFAWVRRGACVPSAGSYFELRPKAGNTSPLEPARPQGVNVIVASATDAPEGTKYYYELWQVLADRREKMLQDPEIEIGPPF